jgi:hypothetical protein
MKQQLTGCKPVQLTELETEFQNLKGGKKAKPERLLRSQQQFAAGPEDDNDGAADGGSTNKLLKFCSMKLKFFMMSANSEALRNKAFLFVKVVKLIKLTEMIDR